MLRRLAGVVVLAAVVVAIVVVGSIRGRIIAGDAVAEPIEPPPQIGDCLTEDPNDLGDALYGWRPYPPSIRMNPCSGPRYGEVVFILNNLDSVDLVQNPLGACAQPANDYLGIPFPAMPTNFAPAIRMSLGMAGPDMRQRSAGQEWAACVVYIPIIFAEEVPITVDHPLRGSWLRQSDARLFALCIDDTSSLLPLDCGRPHHYELLSGALGTPGGTPELAEAACREAVIEALGSPAALDRGDLRTAVLPVRFAPNSDGNMITGPEAITAGGDYFSNCLVTPTDSARRLTASVRGLGDAPVPLN